MTEQQETNILTVAHRTDKGVTRDHNEDNVTAFETKGMTVVSVCDGMGGQAAGELASQIAVEVIQQIISDNDFDTPEDAIRQSVSAANQAVLFRASQDPQHLTGMGSTCVMVIAAPDGMIHSGWVGDSRIYIYEQQRQALRQVSHDQSLVQKLIDSGQLTEQEAAEFPERNVITNAIGTEAMTLPETAVPFQPGQGDIVLLCSDGLTGMVDDSDIERVLASCTTDIEQKTAKLIDMANEAGGFDNITVALMQFGDVPEHIAAAHYDDDTVEAYTTEDTAQVKATQASEEGHRSTRQSQPQMIHRTQLDVKAVQRNTSMRRNIIIGSVTAAVCIAGAAAWLLLKPAPKEDDQKAEDRQEQVKVTKEEKESPEKANEGNNPVQDKIKGAKGKKK